MMSPSGAGKILFNKLPDELKKTAKLKNFKTEAKYERLFHFSKQLKCKVVNQAETIQSLEKMVKDLQAENVSLGTNISTLIKTAAAEIERKDRQIADLRREKDTVVFRRGRETNYNEGNQSRSETSDRRGYQHHSSFGNHERPAYEDTSRCENVDKWRSQHSANSNSYERLDEENHSRSEAQKSRVDIPVRVQSGDVRGHDTLPSNQAVTNSQEYQHKWNNVVSVTGTIQNVPDTIFTRRRILANQTAQSTVADTSTAPSTVLLQDPVPSTSCNVDANRKDSRSVSHSSKQVAHRETSPPGRNTTSFRHERNPKPHLLQSPFRSRSRSSSTGMTYKDFCERRSRAKSSRDSKRLPSREKQKRGTSSGGSSVASSGHTSKRHSKAVPKSRDENRSGSSSRRQSCIGERESKISPKSHTKVRSDSRPSSRSSSKTETQTVEREHNPARLLVIQAAPVKAVNKLEVPTPLANVDLHTVAIQPEATPVASSEKPSNSLLTENMKKSLTETSMKSDNLSDGNLVRLNTLPGSKPSSFESLSQNPPLEKDAETVLEVPKKVSTRPSTFHSSLPPVCTKPASIIQTGEPCSIARTVPLATPITCIQRRKKVLSDSSPLPNTLSLPHGLLAEGNESALVGEVSKQREGKGDLIHDCPNIVPLTGQLQDKIITPPILKKIDLQTYLSRPRSKTLPELQSTTNEVATGVDGGVSGILDKGGSNIAECKSSESNDSRKVGDVEENLGGEFDIGDVMVKDKSVVEERTSIKNEESKEVEDEKISLGKNSFVEPAVSLHVGNKGLDKGQDGIKNTQSTRSDESVVVKTLEKPLKTKAPSSGELTEGLYTDKSRTEVLETVEEIVKMNCSTRKYKSVALKTLEEPLKTKASTSDDTTEGLCIDKSRPEVLDTVKEIVKKTRSTRKDNSVVLKTLEEPLKTKASTSDDTAEGLCIDKSRTEVLESVEEIVKKTCSTRKDKSVALKTLEPSNTKASTSDDTTEGLCIDKSRPEVLDTVEEIVKMTHSTRKDKSVALKTLEEPSKTKSSTSDDMTECLCIDKKRLEVLDTVGTVIKSKISDTVTHDQVTLKTRGEVTAFKPTEVKDVLDRPNNQGQGGIKEPLSKSQKSNAPGNNKYKIPLKSRRLDSDKLEASLSVVLSEDHGGVTKPNSGNTEETNSETSGHRALKQSRHRQEAVSCEPSARKQDVMVPKETIPSCSLGDNAVDIFDDDYQCYQQDTPNAVSISIRDSLMLQLENTLEAMETTPPRMSRLMDKPSSQRKLDVVLKTTEINLPNVLLPQDLAADTGNADALKAKEKSPTETQGTLTIPQSLAENPGVTSITKENIPTQDIELSSFAADNFKVDNLSESIIDVSKKDHTPLSNEITVGEAQAESGGAIEITSKKYMNQIKSGSENAVIHVETADRLDDAVKHGDTAAVNEGLVSESAESGTEEEMVIDLEEGEISDSDDEKAVARVLANVQEDLSVIKSATKSTLLVPQCTTRKERVLANVQADLSVIRTATKSSPPVSQSTIRKELFKEANGSVTPPRHQHERSSPSTPVVCSHVQGRTPVTPTSLKKTRQYRGSDRPIFFSSPRKIPGFRRKDFTPLTCRPPISAWNYGDGSSRKEHRSSRVRFDPEENPELCRKSRPDSHNSRGSKRSPEQLRRGEQRARNSRSPKRSMERERERISPRRTAERVRRHNAVKSLARATSPQLYPSHSHVTSGSAENSREALINKILDPTNGINAKNISRRVPLRSPTTGKIRQINSALTNKTSYTLIKIDHGKITGDKNVEVGSKNNVPVILSSIKQSEPLTNHSLKQDESQTCNSVKQNEPQTCNSLKQNKPQTCDSVKQNKPQTCDSVKQNKPQTCNYVKQNEPQTCDSVKQNEPQTYNSVKQNKPQTYNSVKQNKPQTCYSVKQNEPQTCDSVKQNKPQTCDSIERNKLTIYGPVKPNKPLMCESGPTPTTKSDAEGSEKDPAKVVSLPKVMFHRKYKPRTLSKSADVSPFKMLQISAEHSFQCAILGNSDATTAELTSAKSTTSVENAASGQTPNNSPSCHLSFNCDSDDKNTGRGRDKRKRSPSPPSPQYFKGKIPKLKLSDSTPVNASAQDVGSPTKPVAKSNNNKLVNEEKSRNVLGSKVVNPKQTTDCEKYVAVESSTKSVSKGNKKKTLKDEKNGKFVGSNVPIHKRTTDSEKSDVEESSTKSARKSNNKKYLKEEKNGKVVGSKVVNPKHVTDSEKSVAVELSTKSASKSNSKNSVKEEKNGKVPGSKVVKQKHKLDSEKYVAVESFTESVTKSNKKKSEKEPKNRGVAGSNVRNQKRTIDSENSDVEESSSKSVAQMSSNKKSVKEKSAKVAGSKVASCEVLTTDSDTSDEEPLMKKPSANGLESFMATHLSVLRKYIPSLPEKHDPAAVCPSTSEDKPDIKNEPFTRKFISMTSISWGSDSEDSQPEFSDSESYSSDNVWKPPLRKRKPRKNNCDNKPEKQILPTLQSSGKGENTALAKSFPQKANATPGTKLMVVKRSRTTKLQDN